MKSRGQQITGRWNLTWMDDPIIDYVRISDNPLMWSPGPIYKFGPKKCLFLLNFTRVLWFFWDLNYLIFLRMPFFKNIFGFPSVNWAPKWTKTVNFGCIPFESKFKNLKDFSKKEDFLKKNVRKSEKMGF